MNPVVAGRRNNDPAVPQPIGNTDDMLLSAHSLSKTFPGSVALRDVSLCLHPGEIRALVGENGSGKSTFIKILSGYHHPDPGGTVTIRGQELSFGSQEASHRLGCRFVHQDLGLIDDLTVLDNLAIGQGYPSRMGTIRWRDARTQAIEELSLFGLNVSPNALVRSLSPAQQAGIAIVRAIRHTEPPGPALLVLDEPTAALPADEVHRLLDLVRTVASIGVAVLYVSHRLDEVFAVSESVSVLRDGRLIGTSQTADLDRDSLITQLVGHQLKVQDRHLAKPGARTGRPVIDIDRLVGATLSPVSLQVWPGEIVGIAGITGSGREALLGACFGAAVRLGGQVKINDVSVPPMRPDLAMAAGMAYMPPDRKVLGGVMTMSARENMTLLDLSRFQRLLTVNRARERQEVERWFGDLDIRPRGASERGLETFSGGNQQKILFAKWLRNRPAAFLLDEPTQGVDVGAKEQLHDRLRATANSGAAVVVSSTDLEELVVLCSRVAIMRNGVIVDEVKGADLSVEQLTRRMTTETGSET